MYHAILIYNIFLKLTIKLRDGLSYLISNKMPEVRFSLNISSELCDPATAIQERKT